MEAFHAADTLAFMCAVLGFAVAAQRIPLDDLVLVAKGSCKVLEDLSTAIRQEKEIKGMQIGKEEVKLSLFVNAILLHIKNPEDPIKKMLKLINLAKLQDIKSIHQNQLYFYTRIINYQKIN